jgi:adenylate cyclase
LPFSPVRKVLSTDDNIACALYTAFTYKDKPIDMQRVGRELGVRYTLEGSVRRLGPRIRINVQLIETERGAHLWAERFDGGTDDLFELQDEITARIAEALNLELVAAEVTRPRIHADASDCILRGRAAHNSGISLELALEAIREFERALTLDPGSFEAKSRLAMALAGRVLNFRPLTSSSDIERADALASQAVASSPRSAVTHYTKALVLRAQGRYQDAIREYETVLALDRNWVMAIADIGRCKLFTGPVDEVIPAQQRAIRLSPRDHRIPMWYYRIGQVHLIQSRIDEAIEWLERACAASAPLAILHAYLASAYALSGDSRRAAAELEEVRRLDADGQRSTIDSYRDTFESAIPEIRARVEATFFEGLRRAGMPSSPLL